MSIYRALRLIRIFNGADIKNVAWDLGIDHVELRRIERGDINAPMTVIEGYAAMFGLNVENILFFCPSPGIAPIDRLKNAIIDKSLGILQTIVDNTEADD